MTTKLPPRLPKIKPILANKITHEKVINSSKNNGTSSSNTATNTKLLSDFLESSDKLKFAANLPTEDLGRLLTSLSDAYYNSDALIEDRLFDDIQEVLKLRDPTNKALKNIGAPISDDSPDSGFRIEDYPEIAKRGTLFNNPFYKSKVKLPFLMPSMDKIKSNDSNEYSSWIQKTKGITNSSYNISDKLDGMSVALTYKIDKNNNVIVKLYSRGNGQIGEDLSAIIPYLNLPDITSDIILKYGKDSQIFIRGEILISKKKRELEFGNKCLATRNVARGIMARKTLHTAFLNLLSLVVYELVSPWNSNSITEALNLLDKLGFNVVNNHLVNKILSLDELRQLLIKRKEESDYELDGLIISQDRVPVRDIKPGDKYPSYAIAFKFSSESDDMESAITKVLFVTWNKSKDGKLNPVATIKPVTLGGTNVEHVTVHNARHVIDMGIGPDAIIRVVKGGDVIPHIAESLYQVEPQMPDETIKWNWNETNKAISIVDADNDEQVVQSRIEYFFKKIDVPGWGPSAVDKIFKHGLSKGVAFAQSNIHEILDMDVQDFKSIPGYQGKIAQNLYDSLRQKLSDVNITTLMAASNIFGPGWGERRFQTILSAIPDLLEEPFATEMDREKLLNKVINVQGFQRKTGEPLVQGLAPFIAFLYGIYRLGWIGVFRLNPLPEVYIPTHNDYRNSFDTIWDDLQSMGYSSDDYTDSEYENASILQKNMFQQIKDSLKPKTTNVIPKIKLPKLSITPIKASTASTASTALPTKQTTKPIAKMQPTNNKPSLIGKVIVFTGVHKGLEDQVTMMGGKVTGSVSGNTDILVIKDSDFTSSKVTKAQNIGTKIMTADEFKDLYL